MFSGMVCLAVFEWKWFCRGRTKKWREIIINVWHKEELWPKISLYLRSDEDFGVIDMGQEAGMRVIRDAPRVDATCWLVGVVLCRGHFVQVWIMMESKCNFYQFLLSYLYVDYFFSYMCSNMWKKRERSTLNLFGITWTLNITDKAHIMWGYST